METETLPLRLTPRICVLRGKRRRLTLSRAAFVIPDIGNLSQTRLRRAGVIEVGTITGDVEILPLIGTPTVPTCT